MVLQQGMPIRLWGYAEPGEKLKVSLAKDGIGQAALATADSKGFWKVELKAMKAGGPYILNVYGKNTVTLDDILIGEVWVGSGQSNMEWPVIRSIDGPSEVSNASHPQIRLFTVRKAALARATNDVTGKWAECSPESVPGFSAAAYFFGRELQKELGVPVGLIHSSWGGSSAEAWMDLPTLRSKADWKNIPMRLDVYHKYLADTNTYLKQQAIQKAWDLSNRLADPGNKGFEKGWANADFKDEGWKAMNVPGAWENAGLPIDGAVWFRKTVEIPASWAGKELSLQLGTLDDYDTTYVNGTKVGETGKETASWWTFQRKYKIPASLVKAGNLVISTRIFDDFGGGGFTGQSADLKIFPVGNEAEALPLKGSWKYYVEFGVSPKPTPPQPADPTRVNQVPTLLYNGMIAPLLGLSIRGVIWYQGESNAGRAYQYRLLMQTLIESWRRAWGSGDFHFYIVSLANYMTRKADPVPSAWAELREAQAMALAKKNTALAIAIDIGEGTNIHPKNKPEVGRRLALPALNLVYGKKNVYSGPVYDSMKIEGSKIRLTFKHVGSGLIVSNASNPANPELTGFSIAGTNKEFVWAKAMIEKTGDKESVVVSAESVAKP
ncbi:MAG: 9-O-acetylesterase, partial [Spirochaetia bacterium]|nr:9-O-acetylesterase [Spirochaetia bacterium]